jgi:hypothetical protein
MRTSRCLSCCVFRQWLQVAIALPGDVPCNCFMCLTVCCLASLNFIMRAPHTLGLPAGDELQDGVAHGERGGWWAYCTGPASV